MTNDRLEFLKTMINLDYQNRHDIPQMHFTVADLQHFVEQAELVQNQQKVINSQGRVLEGFITDTEDIKARLIEVRSNIITARETNSLEEHDESLETANNSLNYIINLALGEIDEGYKQ